VIERIARDLGALISIDTYKPEVASAAIAAGAAIVNDVSGLRHAELAEICARTGAGLVVMHTRAEPKQKLFDPRLDGRAVDDVLSLLRQRIAVALDRGVALEQLMLDPGPDFGKTPAQTIEILRALERLHDFERPILLAVSRKDFIGAITGRKPRARTPGTLAAVAHGVDAGAHVLRVHDVREVADFLAVHELLSGARAPDRRLRLADGLRREQAS
jgi:dihydropteroate synthase